jgi:FimV-like protein
LNIYKLGDLRVGVVLVASVLSFDALAARQGPEPIAAVELGQNSQRTVRPGDTLYSIAREWASETGAPVAQSVYGIYRANPHAFGSAGVNGLLSGATLRLPSAAELNSISLQEARNALKELAPVRAEPTGRSSAITATMEPPVTAPETPPRMERSSVVPLENTQETPPTMISGSPLGPSVPSVPLTPSWGWLGLGVGVGGLVGWGIARGTRRRRDDRLNTSMTPVELTEYPSIADIARKCLEETDPLAAVDRVIKSGQISQRDVFTLNIELARAFRDKRDPMTSASFLAGARRLLQPGQNDLAAVLIKALLTLGDKQTASEVAIEIGLRQALPSSLEELEILAVTEGHQQAKRQLTAIRDHGHTLLIEHLEKNVEAIAKAAGRQLVLIEVGSTREQVPTQGSTEKIASFCQKTGIRFITVDMDAHNTTVAQDLFQQMAATDFTAVTARGEAYLEQYPGSIDFLFLDAYDFDHGGHSALRQSRYEQFLGERINDEACHRMHLECAKAAVDKMAPWGVICMDDTWLTDGAWQAKGTLAMPYLLEHGFRLLEMRNRAALLARSIH